MSKGRRQKPRREVRRKKQSSTVICALTGQEMCSADLKIKFTAPDGTFFVRQDQFFFDFFKETGKIKKFPKSTINKKANWAKKNPFLAAKRIGPVKRCHKIDGTTFKVDLPNFFKKASALHVIALTDLIKNPVFDKIIKKLKVNNSDNNRLAVLMH